MIEGANRPLGDLTKVSEGFSVSLFRPPCVHVPPVWSALGAGFPTSPGQGARRGSRARAESSLSSFGFAADEVGYASLRQPESHLLFQVLSSRHDRKKPTVITTNRVFGEWNQIFADDAVAHAILDRLAEGAEVFHLEGTSYRETHRRPAPKVTTA